MGRFAYLVNFKLKKIPNTVTWFAFIDVCDLKQGRKQIPRVLAKTSFQVLSCLFGAYFKGTKIKIKLKELSGSGNYAK